jgi:hypothetical protein
MHLNRSLQLYSPTWRVVLNWEIEMRSCSLVTKHTQKSLVVCTGCQLHIIPESASKQLIDWLAQPGSRLSC